MEWDYTTIELDMDKSLQQWNRVLYDMGASGWQLSGTLPLLGQSAFGVPTTKGARLIFMRPKSPSQP
jgi:uncharacterized Fe-S cluster-containing radical SAM superfamily enzyme